MQLKFVDITKFVMAFLVVAVHARALCGEFFSWDVINYILCLTVPFFFVTSGYLTGRKLDKAASRQARYSAVRDNSRKFGTLYLTWLLIYLPISVIEFFISGTPHAQFVSEYAKSVVFLGESCYSWPLWYVFSMAVSTAVIALFYKKRWHWSWLVAIGVVSALVDWMIEYDPSLLESDNSMVRHIASALRFVAWRPFLATLYLLIGMAVFRWRTRLVNWHVAGLCLAAGALLFAFHLPFWRQLSGAAVFIAALQIPVSDSPWWLRLRSYSSIVYFTHMLVGYAAFRLLPGVFNGSNALIPFGIMSVVSLLLAVGLNAAFERGHASTLKKLF